MNKIEASDWVHQFAVAKDELLRHYRFDNDVDSVEALVIICWKQMHEIEKLKALVNL